MVEPKAILDMGIEKNRDLLSLVTCTPYGINTKRLVVRAKRVFPKKKEKKCVNHILLGNCVLF